MVGLSFQLCVGDHQTIAALRIVSANCLILNWEDFNNSLRLSGRPDPFGKAVPFPSVSVYRQGCVHHSPRAIRHPDFSRREQMITGSQFLKQLNLFFGIEFSE